MACPCRDVHPFSPNPREVWCFTRNASSSLPARPARGDRPTTDFHFISRRARRRGSPLQSTAPGRHRATITHSRPRSPSGRLDSLPGGLSLTVVVARGTPLGRDSLLVIPGNPRRLRQSRLREIAARSPIYAPATHVTAIPLPARSLARSLDLSPRSSDRRLGFAGALPPRRSPESRPDLFSGVRAVSADGVHARIRHDRRRQTARESAGRRGRVHGSPHRTVNPRLTPTAPRAAPAAHGSLPLSLSFSSTSPHAGDHVHVLALALYPPSSAVLGSHKRTAR